MTVPANKNPSSPTIVISDRDVENLLLEFGGNSKEAIRALLHDLAILAEDRDNSVSFGYVRGQLFNNKPDQQIKKRISVKNIKILGANK